MQQPDEGGSDWAPCTPNAASLRRRDARVTAEAAPDVSLGYSTVATPTVGPVGSVTLVGPGHAFEAGEVDIRRAPRGSYAGIFGNPYEMRGEHERNSVIAAYHELLRGGSTVEGIARRRGLRVDPRPARIPFEKRMTALSKLAVRVRRGEHLRLRCSCTPLPCHGDVIVAWVRKRSIPP